MQKLDIKKRLLLVTIIPKNLSEDDAVSNLKELVDLVDAYEGEIVDFIIQRREVHAKGPYIGRGKMEEVKRIMLEKEIDIIVFNAIIKPTQLYDFYVFYQKHKFSIKVWDKIDLILNIFSKHAKAPEAKLQIELAMLRHTGPRIYGMGSELSRQSGMLGTRGIGETNTEREKRDLKEQIRRTQQKIKKLTQSRQMLIDRRKRNGLKTISLIGYTNAGKTSLFNLLTKKQKEVKNALFVTLDSSVGKVFLQDQQKEVLVSDTIGFIRNLPPQLIDAFRSTLLESLHSDVLLHVIDISDPEMELKIEVVENVLKGLKLSDKPRLYIFNKMDQMNGIKKEYIEGKYEQFQPQFISATEGKGIETLTATIGKQI